MTYNVNWDSIFPADDPHNDDLRTFNRVEPFRRILRALRPDIVCLQEINHIRNPKDLAAFLQATSGSPASEPWHVAIEKDDVIATRFDLTEQGMELRTGSLLAVLDQAAALVNLPDSTFGATDLYMICAHFVSGGRPDDIRLRNRQADVIMAQVRDLETPGGALDLPPRTPFVILGDFNAYNTDPARHIQTLTQGDIEREEVYGPDVEPDWDGTALRDVQPSHNGRGIDVYTWRNDTEPFDPWALDRVIYSDSVLQVVNAFVLDTTEMSDDALTAHELERADVLLEPATGLFDHLPVVVDFRLAEVP
jgi:endonuclease/exonuclease/phosphatase family metal-dependent hydrolase